jgi:2-hydroxychromene-2-carboxylate isomerase
LALKSVSNDQQKKVIDCFFRAVWEQGLDIGNSDIVSNILAKENFPVLEWMEKISSKDIRLELKKNSELAISRGVFGVPTFFYNQEMFWGNDSIEYLLMALNNNDPLDYEKYKNFLTKHPFNL